MRILVVEDDRKSASWLIKGLTEAGHVANHARDGAEGVALAHERLHDVVVMDRMMPQLDGLAAIRMMRADGIHTPVLILSALCDVDEKVKGLRAGGDDYLAKPMPLPSSLPASRRWRGGAPPSRSRRGCAPAISRSISWRAPPSGPASRSCCSRANSSCSNISCAMPAMW